VGYYLRFIATAERAPTIPELRAALAEVDAGYALDDTGERAADLRLGDAVVGEIEINTQADELFNEELGELLEFLESADGDANERQRVLTTLTSATAIVCARVLWGDREAEQTLRAFDPLWAHLFASSGGLLQADDEGYYDEDGLILEVG
jgi:hypothetical protein